MTITEVAAKAAARRASARAMRAGGKSWKEIGAALGVSYQRASQLGKPLQRKPLPTPAPKWRGTIGELIDRNARRVEESCAAVLRMLVAKP